MPKIASTAAAVVVPARGECADVRGRESGFHHENPQLL
jgi:hypothetical protein